jgi:hypothetical protein
MQREWEKWEMRTKFFVGKLKDKRSRGKFRIRLEDYIKNVLKYETAALPLTDVTREI